jgi:hypothetical protein
MSKYVSDIDTAERHLTVLATFDFTYKDVSALLDKISKLRENPESEKSQQAEDNQSESETEGDDLSGPSKVE